jgi:hypothetical protein
LVKAIRLKYPLGEPGQGAEFRANAQFLDAMLTLFA